MKPKNQFKLFFAAIIAALSLSCNQQQTNSATTEGNTASGDPDRTVLPIKEPSYPDDTTLDARNAKAPARFEVKAPAKAPNIVIVLIDDQGLECPVHLEAP